MRGDVVSITASEDTGLSEQAPDANEATAFDFIVGAQGDFALGILNRALVRFPVSEMVPAGATIQRAELNLTVQKTPRSPVDSNFELHRMLTRWIESETTWNGPSAGNTWGAPGVAANVDYVQTPSALQPSGVSIQTITFSNVTADAQFWLDHPDSNFGWIIKSDTEERFTARRIGTTRGTSGPTLVITYTSVLKIDAITVLGDQVLIEFKTSPGFDYVVQWTDNLASPGWQELQRFDASPDPVTQIAQDSTSSGPQRFYRLCQVIPTP